MDDARALFDSNKEKSWSGLSKELQRRRGKAEGISDTLIIMMMPIVQHLQEAHRPYPESPQELYDVLNAELAKAPEPAKRY